MKTTNFKKMKRRIMLRVYYIYGLRLLLAPATLHVAVLAAAVYGIGYFVHVAAVLQNLSRIPLGEVAPWLVRAVLHTQGITLLVLGVAILAALSLPIQLPQYKRSLRKEVQAV
tara:strand:- start:1847 stop:2185 length:339 start_codon:yes stop_codon:yes gene_type:complete